MSHIHWVDRGTGIPKDRDEVNRREVCECDGWVCDLDVMGDPSKLSVIRKAAALARVRPTFLLNCWEKAERWKWNMTLLVSGSWTPEAAKKLSVSRWACKNKSLTNSLCDLPDVLAIAGICVVRKLVRVRSPRTFFPFSFLFFLFPTACAPGREGMRGKMLAFQESGRCGINI